jgi:hypothetical protein
VQSQVWTDNLGHVRANVLLRNPNAFPVRPGGGTAATLRNSAGELVRGQRLYYLDGISGGGGFLLPGETIAANACWTCEAEPLSQDWASVDVEVYFSDVTGEVDYSTEVEGGVTSVTFEGDSPIFDFAGTVTNHSAGTLQRISLRLIVYDPAGRLIGAGEGSAWDVGPGATAAVNSYGFGQAPAGEYEYEATALGVTY